MNKKVIKKYLIFQLVALQQKAEQLKRLHATVESYEARGVARTLETVRKTVDELQSQREEIMTQRQEIAGRIEELTADLASQQVCNDTCQKFNFTVVYKKVLYSKVFNMHSVMNGISSYQGFNIIETVSI
jgi:uncharacterized protein YigA (DUF484 family)